MINPDAVIKTLLFLRWLGREFFIKSSPLSAGFETRIRKNIANILKKGGNYGRESNRA